MSDRGRTNTIETVLVTILLIIFATAIFLLVASGGEAYKNILKNRESLSRARVASSYINVKIRQNDTTGAVYISDDAITDKKTLVIIHTGQLDGYVTYIFFDSGALYESFVSEDIRPGMDNALMICRVNEVKISSSDDERSILISSGYMQNNKPGYIDSQIYLRSGERSSRDK